VLWWRISSWLKARKDRLRQLLISSRPSRLPSFPQNLQQIIQTHEREIIQRISKTVNPRPCGREEYRTRPCRSRGILRIRLLLSSSVESYSGRRLAKFKRREWNLRIKGADQAVRGPPNDSLGSFRTMTVALESLVVVIEVERTYFDILG
jgi:hypothetical protein